MPDVRRFPWLFGEKIPLPERTLRLYIGKDKRVTLFHTILHCVYRTAEDKEKGKTENLTEEITYFRDIYAKKTSS